MKKILFTRRLIETSEEYASNLFSVKFNVDDIVLSKEEIISQSNDCDGIISTMTEVFDDDIISNLSKSIKIISNKKNEGVSACRNKGISNAKENF